MTDKLNTEMCRIAATRHELVGLVILPCLTAGDLEDCLAALAQPDRSTNGPQIAARIRSILAAQLREAAQLNIDTGEAK